MGLFGNPSQRSIYSGAGGISASMPQSPFPCSTYRCNLTQKVPLMPSCERWHLWHSGFLPCQRCSCANRIDCTTESSFVFSETVSDFGVSSLVLSLMGEKPTTFKSSALMSNAMLGLASSILIRAASASVGRKGC